MIGSWWIRCAVAGLIAWGCATKSPEAGSESNFFTCETKADCEAQGSDAPCTDGLCRDPDAGSSTDAACDPGERLGYFEPGCDGTAAPVCTGSHDACISTFCYCDGTTGEGDCGFATRPFASFGECPQDSGLQPLEACERGSLDTFISDLASFCAALETRLGLACPADRAAAIAQASNLCSGGGTQLVIRACGLDGIAASTDVNVMWYFDPATGAFVGAYTFDGGIDLGCGPGAYRGGPGTQSCPTGSDSCNLCLPDVGSTCPAEVLTEIDEVFPIVPCEPPPETPDCVCPNEPLSEETVCGGLGECPRCYDGMCGEADCVCYRDGSLRWQLPGCGE